MGGEKSYMRGPSPFMRAETWFMGAGCQLMCYGTIFVGE